LRCIFDGSYLRRVTEQRDESRVYMLKASWSAALHIELHRRRGFDRSINTVNIV
jgi:hypothetical protein